MVVQSRRRFCPFPLMCCSDIIRETYCATLGHPETNVLQVAALFSPSGNSGTAPVLWKHEERTWFLQINIISQEILSGGSRGLLALLLNKATPSRHLLLSLTFEGRRSNTDWDCLWCPIFTRGNGHKLKCKVFCLSIGKHFVAMQVTEHWHRLCREAVKCLETFLEIFKTCLGTALGTLVWVSLLERMLE